jgi:hypothetical protein
MRKSGVGVLEEGDGDCCPRSVIRLKKNLNVRFIAYRASG